MNLRPEVLTRIREVAAIPEELLPGFSPMERDFIKAVREFANKIKAQPCMAGQAPGEGDYEGLQPPA